MTTSRCQPMPRFTQLRDSASLICSFWAAPCPASRQPAPVKRRSSRRVANAKAQENVFAGDTPPRSERGYYFCLVNTLAP